MAEPRPALPFVSEETARLKWFEAFMHRRVELEQQMISGLRALLEGAPRLPERKQLWHCAIEKLLERTQEELHARAAELGSLKDQMQALGMSIAKAEACIGDLNIEFEKLGSTESLDSAQAAAATSHKEWLDIKLVDISVLSNLLSSGKALKEKLEKLETEKSLKVNEALEKCHDEGLRYRRTVIQQRVSQEQFLDSIPDRIQEYGAKYWTAICNVGMVMESLSNYLRNVSSTCNSSGSALWASAKDIKLVDANFHTEAIEFAYHQSPIRFSPIYYQNPGFISRPPRGQTILFGCSLKLRTVGELKKIPPVLEYLLDSVRDWPDIRRAYTSGKHWPLVDENEQAWTGVEENDRAFISKLDQANVRHLIREYFWTLPKPVLSNDDIELALKWPRDPPRLIWDTWSKDPIKAAVLRALFFCQVRSGGNFFFGNQMADALNQRVVSSDVDKLLFSLSRDPDRWRSVISSGQNVQEGI